MGLLHGDCNEQKVRLSAVEESVANIKERIKIEVKQISGLFQFKVTSFVLCNALSTFEKLMDLSKGKYIVDTDACSTGLGAVLSQVQNK